jgi:hypothetical protein
MHFCVVGVDRNLIMTVEHSLALQSAGKLYKSSLETTVNQIINRPFCHVLFKIHFFFVLNVIYCISSVPL